jgi:hypothetical protein
VIYGSFSLITLGGAYALFVWFNHKARRANLINVMEHQTTMDVLTRLNAIESYFKVQETRAANSMFAGASNLTYSPTHTKNIESHEPVALLEDTQEQQPEVEMTLEALENNKFIGRSGNSLLVGFGEKEQN